MASKYKLTYFDFPGMAEPIRFLFAYGGIEFEDYRIQREQWPALKPNAPFGQIPILEFDGKTINQTFAIARYVAKLVELAGKDDIHALEIDAMVDNINDLRVKISEYVQEHDEEQKEKKRVPLMNETLPFMLGKMDAIAEANNGYFVRGELSWADLTFTSFVDFIDYGLKCDLLEKYPSLQKVRSHVFAVPNIKKYVDNRPKPSV